MKLSQSQKILIGILTLLPFLFVPYFIFQVFSFVMTTVSNDRVGIDLQPVAIISAILSFIFPIILLSLLSLGLFIFYIIHTVNNKNMESTERIIWILLFIFVGFIIFPIYWFMRIWNDSKSEYSKV
jgi:hypothetical protein